MDPRPASRPPIAWAFSFVLGVVALQLTLGIAAQLTDIAVGLAYTEALLFAAPAVLACRLLGYPPLDFLAARPPPGRWLALGFGLGLANYPIAGGLEALVRGLNPAWRDLYDSSQLLAGASGPELGLLVVAVGLCAPAGEELAFRGFAQRVLGGSWPPALAIAVSAALFSAIHFDPIGFPARLELGLLFGLLAYWSGSLWTGAAAHAANNLGAMALYFAAGGREAADAEPGLLQLLELLLLGVALSAPLLGLARRLRQEPPPLPERQVQPGRWGDLLAWAAAVAVCLGLMVALDPVGFRIGQVDATYPASRLRKRLATPAERQRLDERLRELRAQARSGQLSLEGYARRRQLLDQLARSDGAGPVTLRELEKKLEAPEENPRGPAAAKPDGG